MDSLWAFFLRFFQERTNITGLSHSERDLQEVDGVRRENDEADDHLRLEFGQRSSPHCTKHPSASLE